MHGSRYLTVGLFALLILQNFSAKSQIDSSKLKNPMGEVFNVKTYDSLLKRRSHHMGFHARIDSGVPDAFSLKKYCPSVAFQFGGSCFAFASAYAARTMLYNITMNDSLVKDSNCFSAGFLVNILQPKSWPLNTHCIWGGDIGDACLVMENIGAVKVSNYANSCSSDSYKNYLDVAALYKIRVSDPLFDLCADSATKISAVKSAIAQKRPVVIAINSLPSFHEAYGEEVWTPDASESSLYECKESNHAICVVGYDDHLFGGSVEIMNSWGTDWGKSGFIHIRYGDFVHILMYAIDIRNPN